jgi:predicted nucleotidyltransferase
MTGQLSLKIPADALERLCRRYSVRELALFGSALREDFGPDSDLDVLVTFEAGSHVGFLALAALQRELQELLGRRVDLVPRDGLKAMIQDEILGQARIFYAA